MRGKGGNGRTDGRGGSRRRRGSGPPTNVWDGDRRPMWVDDDGCRPPAFGDAPRALAAVSAASVSSASRPHRASRWGPRASGGAPGGLGDERTDRGRRTNGAGADGGPTVWSAPRPTPLTVGPPGLGVDPPDQRPSGGFWGHSPRNPRRLIAKPYS